jgi:hypothetical protein
MGGCGGDFDVDCDGLLCFDLGRFRLGLFEV